MPYLCHPVLYFFNPANLKGKANPDLPSICSNYWPPNVALSLCNHLVIEFNIQYRNFVNLPMVQFDFPIFKCYFWFVWFWFMFAFFISFDISIDFKFCGHFSLINLRFCNWKNTADSTSTTNFSPKLCPEKYIDTMKYSCKNREFPKLYICKYVAI